MFFLQDLEHPITLHPSFFGSRTREYLTNRLYADMEGTCTGEYYIVCVMDSLNISAGRVVPGRGEAEYTISYRAIVWKPFKGESIDVVVSSVKSMGIFADAGPLQVFVSRFNVPDEIKYEQDATPPQYTDNGESVIEAGTSLRVKLLGIRTDVASMWAVATIREDYLGAMN